MNFSDVSHIDWEKPPGKEGTIHYQVGRHHYNYDPIKKQFKGLNNKLQKKLLKNPEVQQAIQKGLKNIKN